MSQGILVSQFSTGMQKFIKINGIDRNNNGVIELKNELPNLETELDRIGGSFVDTDGTKSLLGYSNPKWGGKPSHSYDLYPNNYTKEEVAFIYEEKQGVTRSKTGVIRINPLASFDVRSYREVRRNDEDNSIAWRGTIQQTDGKVKLYGGQTWKYNSEEQCTDCVSEKYYDENGNEIKGMCIDYRF